MTRFIGELPRHYGRSPQDAELQREPGQTDERRRARVLAKVRGAGTATPDKLREVAAVFSPGRVEIEEHSAEARFVIRYLDTIREIAGQADLAAIINELKPAHLAWSIQYQEHFLLRQESRQRPRYTVEVYVGLLPRVGETFILRQEG